MAKKRPALDMFARTAPEQHSAGDNSDLDQGRIRPTGVGLSEGEIRALAAIGEEQGGIARNALLRLAARRFILEYRAGRIDLASMIEEPPPPKKKLRYPG